MSKLTDFFSTDPKLALPFVSIPVTGSKPRTNDGADEDEFDRNLRIFGQHPPPDELTPFETYRKEHNMNCPCGCAVDLVEDCFTKFIESIQTKGYDGNNYHNGILNILKAYFKLDTINSTGDSVILDILNACKHITEDLTKLKKYDDPLTKDNYVPYYIQQVYNITWEEAHAVLCYIDECGYIEHGCSIRCPWLSEKGTRILQLYKEQN